MKVRLVQCEDEDEAKELNRLAFPDDPWYEECRDGMYWIAYDEAGNVVGFCAAKFYEDERRVELTRAAVTKTAQGLGIQRRMIRTRVNWGRRMGAKRATTYTTIDNYPSIMNLLACGFRFDKGTDEAFHFFAKDLTSRTSVPR